ncbi:MAG: energy transducer TonB [Bacteroidales bacterium]|nr:energy transducer TonB [Bacteroidales bacterium]
MKIRAVILSLVLLLPLVPVKAQEQTEEPILICYQEKKPSFNGGDANEFSKWVNEHKCYPEYTQFTITKEGKLVNVRILRGVHPLLDEEAIRVIESAPQIWKPGENHKGEPMALSLLIPVNFNL